MESYRRLPHFHPLDRLLFLTWHLYGSLPHNRYPPPEKSSAGQAFVWMDRYLDAASSGPRFLDQEPIAGLVEESIRYGAGELNNYTLHAYVIMTNHVHMLVLPRVAPSRFMQTLKGYTARQANRLLSRTGQPFWQCESFDHSVRDGKEAERITAYIENNPVKAGLVASAEDYRWSSAWRGQ